MARLKMTTAAIPTRKVYSVAELNAKAKTILEQALSNVWVEAEISNLTLARSGHWYFSLKDSKGQISCAMFRGNNSRCQVTPTDGMKVLVRGRVSLYEPRGNYQLIIEHLELAGQGDLLQQFEQLKAKLAAEGLFDPQRKQPITQFNARIGLITSATGAALHDVISTFKRRYPLQELILYPSQVQGATAAVQLIKQLSRANDRAEVDVILLVRGGGSIEDLWCFNDEALARAIFASSIPVVSGVGHEVDFTIADFVADLRAATPTAAAEATSPDQNQLMQRLQQRQQWLVSQILGQLQQVAQRLDWTRRQLSNPQRLLAQHRQSLLVSVSDLRSAYQSKLGEARSQLHQQRLALGQRDPRNRIQGALSQCRQLKNNLHHVYGIQHQSKQLSLSKLASRLDSMSPLKVLARGYSVTLDADSHVITDATQVQKGTYIQSRLAKGRLISQVVETESER